MQERAAAQATKTEADLQSYVRQTAAGSGSTADELAKLADLRDRGTTSPDEFEPATAKILVTAAAAPAVGGNRQPAATT